MATLTTVKGAQRTLQENVPSEKLSVSLNYGKLRILHDSYTVDAADEFGTDGLIRLFTIPKGARLIDFETTMPASGANGIFEIGWAAGADGVEAADPNGIATVDPGDAAVERAKMLSSAPGYMKKFEEAVEVQADCTEATADSGGDTFYFTAIISVE